jgi:hypothetical protein
MGSDSNEYVVMLGKFRAQRAALDAMITALEQLLGLSGIEDIPSVAPVSGDRRMDELRSDSFFGLSIPDAIRKYLGVAKAPQSLSDIAHALQKGGMITTSKNILSTVSATLVRMKRNDGDVVPVQGKWGLTEWYKGMRREKLEPRKSKRTRKRGQSAQPKAQPPKTPKAPAHGPTPEQIVQMKALFDTGKSYGQIAKELGIATLTVWRTLKPKEGKKAQAVG